MTDRTTPDDTAAPDPRVIDLDAEEIKAEEVADPRPEDTAETIDNDVPPAREADEPPAPPPPPPVPPRKKRSGKALGLLALLLLGAAGGAWLYRDVLQSYFPSNHMKAIEADLINLKSANDALSQKFAALTEQAQTALSNATAAQDAARAAGDGLPQLGQRVDTLDQGFASLQEKLSKAESDLDQFRRSMSQGGSTGAAPADSAALAALGQRLDALEKDVASLKTARGTGETSSVTTALSQALADLKAKVAAGTGYQAEYDRIARMVPAAPGLDVLASSAAEGIADARGLAQELRAAIPSLPQPEAPAAADDSYWNSFVSSLSGIITIRDIGESDWPQLAEKAAAFAESGDLTQAIATIDAAEGEKPVPLSQWRERAAQRLRLEAAIAQVSDAVLRQISAFGGAQ